jgi:hypothetical protein
MPRASANILPLPTQPGTLWADELKVLPVRPGGEALSCGALESHQKVVFSENHLAG